MFKISVSYVYPWGLANKVKACLSKIKTLQKQTFNLHNAHCLYLLNTLLLFSHLLMVHCYYI